MNERALLNAEKTRFFIPIWITKNGSTDLTESQLIHLLVYGIWMQLEVLPPSHPQPGSKNKWRCVIKCYQSAIKSGENLKNL